LSRCLPTLNLTKLEVVLQKKRTVNPTQLELGV
jgi:hypothetical protein